MEYTIVYKINSLDQIPAFDERKDGVNSCAYIARDGERYGVITDGGDIVLMFEFDNITVIDFGILLLIKNGKMGMLHLGRDGEREDFYAIRSIPCKYDYIEAQSYKDAVFLHNYDATRTLSRIYLTQPRLLTEAYNTVRVIEGPHFNCALMERNGTDTVVDARTGEVICESAEYTCCSIFKTRDNIVLLQYPNTGDARLLCINSDTEVASEYACHNAYAILGFDEYDEAVAVGFIAQVDDMLRVLDENCRPLSDGDYSQIGVRSRVIGMDVDGHEHIIPLPEQIVLGCD